MPRPRAPVTRIPLSAYYKLANNDLTEFRVIRPVFRGLVVQSQREPTMPDTSPVTDSKKANAQGLAAEHLRSFVERLERLAEEKKAIADDMKEVMAEAKGTGFEPKIIRLILKIRKQEDSDRQEEQELLDIYKAALGMD